MTNQQPIHIPVPDLIGEHLGEERYRPAEHDTQPLAAVILRPWFVKQQSPETGEIFWRRVLDPIQPAAKKGERQNNMKNLKLALAIGAALVVLLCGALIAGAIDAKTAYLILSVSPVFGAVTVTYLNTAFAGTVAPTAAQARQVNFVAADIIASADGDVTATFTHNWALSTAQLAQGFPFIILTPLLSQALTALSAWTAGTIATNSFVLTKLASTGSGNAAAQLRVTALRPTTLIQ